MLAKLGPTNSVSWSNIDNTTNTGSFYQNAGFNFGTTPANGTNYTSPDVVAGITAGTPFMAHRMVLLVMLLMALVLALLLIGVSFQTIMEALDYV